MLDTPGTRTPPLPAAPPPAAPTKPAARPAPPARSRRRLGFAAGALVVAVAVIAGLYLLVGRPLPVTIAGPERDVAIEVYGLGSVEGRHVAAIGFEVAGTLRALHADQGDRVAAGTVLAELDSRLAEARVAQARAGVAQARAALDEAEASLGKAEVGLAQARRTSARRQELARTRAVSEQAAEEAQTAVETAEADRAQAASRIRVAQANLEQAEATLVHERTLLDQHALAAPFAALVVTRQRELGAPVRAADPVFELVDPTTVWLRVYVDEALSGRLALGQPAAIRLRSLPGAKFHGMVARIGIENDRIGEERRVELTCGDCPPDFHLGEQAEAVITTTHLATALMLPFAAFEEVDARGGVAWTIEDGRLRRRRITFGHRTLDGRVEVPAAALPAEAKVVAERRPGLREGREAVAVPADAGR